MTAEVVITARKDGKLVRVEGQRVHFSAHQCFAFDDGPEDLQTLARLGEFLCSKPGLAIFAGIGLAAALTRHGATGSYAVPTIFGALASFFTLSGLSPACAAS